MRLNYTVTMEIEFYYPWRLLLFAPLFLLWWHGTLRRPAGAAFRLPFDAGPARTRITPSTAALAKLLALTLLVTALARPGRSGAEIREPRRGVDIMLICDVSRSMLAADYGPPDNPLQRIEAARNVLLDFIERRPNDRIGMVIFGNAAYPLAPLTLERDMLKSEISDLWIGKIDGTRTAIAEALAVAVQRLRAGVGNVRARSRIVILITDGENNVSAPVEPDDIAFEAFHSDAIKFYTIGILPGRHSEKERVAGADEATLVKIADRGGGRFYFAASQSEIAHACAQINRLEKSPMTARGGYDFHDFYGIFVMLGFAAWILALILEFSFFRVLP